MSLVESVVFLVVVALFIYVLSLLARIVHVAAGRVKVTQWYDRSVARQLKQGWHWLGLTESVFSYTWTYTDQNYVQRVLSGSELCVVNAQQVDMVPFECKTNDGKSVSVDTLFTWRVFDPVKACITAPDVLALLCQQIISQIRNQVAQMKESNLTRNEREIAAAACAIIAKEWTPKYGLEVITCEIQNISSDDETVRYHRNRRNGLKPEDIARIEHAHALGTVEKRTLVNI